LHENVQTALTGQDFPPFSPHQEDAQAQPEQSPAELAQQFAQLRQEAVDQLEQVTAAEANIALLYQRDQRLSAFYFPRSGRNACHTITACNRSR
jgi:hypothetical protein